MDPENVVFALVRNLKATDDLKALGRDNVHIVQADIVDSKALKVRLRYYHRLGHFLIFLKGCCRNCFQDYWRKPRRVNQQRSVR